METVKSHKRQFYLLIQMVDTSEKIAKKQVPHPKISKNRHQDSVVSQERELLSKVCVNSLIAIGAFDEIILCKQCLKCNFYS